MPADYPFESTSLFNDKIVITDAEAEIDLSAVTSDPSTWAVKVNDVTLQFENDYFHAENDGVSYTLYNENGQTFVDVWDMVADERKPGTYSVQIDEMTIDENFRNGVEACGQGGQTSNVPELPDPSETQNPQYIRYNRLHGWDWSDLRPAPVQSMANPYAGVVEGTPAAFAQFPGHLNGGGVPSSMRGDSLYMLAYQALPGSGMSKWGVQEIMKAPNIDSAAVNATYTLKLKKTGESSYIVNWVKDTKYVHNIHLYGDGGDYYFTLITNSGAAISADGLVTAIHTAYGNAAPIPASGRRYKNSTLQIACSVYVTQGSYFNVFFFTTSGTSGAEVIPLNDNMHTEDISIIAL